MPTQPVISVYPLPMSDLRALYLIRSNIRALLVARHENQSQLAFAMGRDKSWINKFLNGTREIQFKDLDRLASFFGIATYQLFQPGISAVTERRKLADRRNGRDRRIGHPHRILHAVSAVVAETHPRQRTDPHEAATNRAAAALRSLASEFVTRADRLLQEADVGGQVAETGTALPPARTRRRTRRGSDAPHKE